jgi:hypothetical protein
VGLKSPVYPDGDFVVVWQSPQDGDDEGVLARRFSSAGAALTAELQVNVTTVNPQRIPSVATEGNGDFVVVWTALGGLDGSGGAVFRRRFDSASGPLSGELLVNTSTQGYQQEAQVDMDDDGDVVVVWRSKKLGAAIAAIRRTFWLNATTSPRPSTSTATGSTCR